MKKLLLMISLGLLISCSQKSSDDHIAAAKAYLDQNDVKAAVIELKNAIQTDPQSAAARFELGKLYVETRQYESAEKELSRAMELGYDAATVLPLLTRAYKYTGAYAALNDVDLDIVSDAAKAEVGYAKLQSFVQLQKLDDARILIEDLSSLETRSVYKGLIMSYIPLLEERYEDAVTEVEALREQSPGNEDVLKLLGQLYLQQQRADEAVDVYASYVVENPDDKQTAFVLAKLLVDLGKTAEAEPYVDDLMTINAENPLLNELKATIRAAEGGYKEAQQFAERAIQGGRGAQSLRLIAGFAAYQQGDYEGAQHHLSYIASSLPDNHPGLKMLAAAQLQIGQSSDAGNVLGRINQLTDEDALLFSKAGYELIRAGNFKQAKEVVEKTSSLSQSAEDLTRLGVLKLSLNDISGIIELEKAVEKSPSLRSANSTLATAYISTKQWDKAVALADEWHGLEPDAIEPLVLKGEALVNLQQYEEAKVVFSQVLEKESGNGIARLAMANITVLEGDDQSGVAQIEAILDEKPDFLPALGVYYLIKKKLGASQDAEEKVKLALNVSPDNMELQSLLARIYLSQEQWQNALQVVNAMNIDQQSAAPFWVLKGQTLLRNNMVREASEHYDDWLTFDKNNKQAVMGKLMLLDNKREFADALELVNGFLEVRDDPQVEVLRTHFLTMNQSFPQAREALAELPEEYMKMPLLQAVKSRLLVAEKKHAEALPFAKNAYEGTPTSRNLILLLAIYEINNNRQAGIELLAQHVNRFPSDVSAKMLLAEREISSGKGNPIATYEATLALNPDNFVVLNNLAYLYLEQGRVSEAKQHATRAVELQPENAAALDTLAQVYVAESNYEAALRYYDRALNKELQSEDIYLNYVETLLSADQIRLAERKIEQREMTTEQSKKRLAELKQKYGI